MGIMSIENPTLVHFRHLSHFSSLLTNFPSTTVENSLQITPFYAKQSQSQVGQKQPKLFCDKYIRSSGTIGYSDKQSQNKPNLSQNKPNSNPIKANTNPIVSKAKNERFCAAKELYDCFCDFLADFTTLKGANFSNEAGIW